MHTKLRCYFSEAITLLKQEGKENELKNHMKYYDFIVKLLEQEYNCSVFNPIREEAKMKPEEIYYRDLFEIRKAGFIVADVSVVSWGVGEELIYAIMKGKPILALYNIDSGYKLSEMVTGSGIRLRTYSGNSRKWKQEITKHIAEFMTDLKQYFYLRRKMCARIQ
jgi:hypothetical protein